MENLRDKKMYFLQKEVIGRSYLHQDLDTTTHNTVWRGPDLTLGTLLCWSSSVVEQTSYDTWN